MSNEFLKLLNQGSKINVLGILVILILGILAGILFTTQLWPWGVVVIVGGGFYGMIRVWVTRPREGR
jgi:uncharacterized membrane protein